MFTSMAVRTEVLGMSASCQSALVRYGASDDADWAADRRQDHPDTAIAYHNLAMVFLARGDSEAARKTFEQALAIQRKVLGTRHPLTAMTQAKLGMLLADRGEQARAMPHLKQALAVLADVLPPDNSVVLSLRLQIRGRKR